MFPIEIKPDWFLFRTGVLLSSWLLVMASPDFWVWLGLAVLVYFAYNTIHEFIHLFAIWWHKGKASKLYLGYPHAYIDFRMPTQKTEKEVWKAGAYADIVMGVLVTAIMLCGTIFTGNYIWAVLAFGFYWLFITEELLPDASDFQQYRKSIKQCKLLGMN